MSIAELPDLEIPPNTLKPRKSFVKNLYALHAWIGLFVGILMLLIGVTGILTLFKPEVDWLLTPALRVTPAATIASVDEVIAAIRKTDPSLQPKSVELQYGSRWAHTVMVVAPLGAGVVEKEIFVNPYTAHVQGSRSGTSTAEIIKRFHTNLWLNFAGGNWGLVGRACMGFLGLVLVILSVTGFYIYRKAFRGAFRIRLKHGKRSMYADIHKVLGIWTVGFNLLMGGTALIFGIKDGSKLFKPEIERRELVRGGSSSLAREFTMKHGKIQQSLDVASTAAPGIKIQRIIIPQTPKDKIKVFGTLAGVPQQKVNIEVEIADAPVASLVHPRAQGTVEKVVNGTLKPLHFAKLFDGTNWSYAMKGLWAILGMSPVFLSLTGFTMYLRRRR